MTDVVLALMSDQGRWFLQRRSVANPVLPGCWEFPGGKVADGETLLAALAREVREEVGLHVLGQVALPTVEGPVRLHPFLVEVDGVVQTELPWGWFTTREMSRLPLPPANAALVSLLAALSEAGRAGSTGPSDTLEPSGPEMP